MPNRAPDWLAQAHRDAGTFHEWACFAAQQAAEKAVKALAAALGGEARGHSIVAIAMAMPNPPGFSVELVDCARRLDRFYIPTRYPNGFAQGAPQDYFTERDAQETVADAERILAYCASHIS